MKKIILYTILILCISSCQEDPPVFDPCKDERPTTADFTIHEGFGFVIDEAWIPYDTDTIATSRAVFTAVEDDESAEYEWVIGAEVIRGRSVSRQDFPFNTPIPITLKVTKRPDSSCFPEDDGVEIKTRVLYRTRDLLVLGNYRGINTDEPNREFNVNIQAIDVGDNEEIFKITSLNPDYPDCSIEYSNWFDLVVGYKQIYIGHNNNFDCLRPLSLARVHGVENDSITIDYGIQTAPGSENVNNRVNKTFKGKRIE